MKKLLLSLSIALLAGIATAQNIKTVNCTTAGTLYTLLTKPEYTTITNLTVTGNIDARDVYFMRDSMPVLAVLNLETVQIKAYGTYADNAMPDSSFIKKASLTSIQLPVSLTVIGGYAFDECSSLTGNLIIPNAVVSIGNYAFCSGESSQFTGSLTIPNSVTFIGDNAFSNCRFTGNLTIGHSLTSIGSYAFYDCRFTGNLTIPNSVISIGANAFTFCGGFTGSLTIGHSLTSIGYAAFSQCTGLTDLTIPNSVTSIGDWAFGYCSGLQKITVGIVVPLTITANTFYNVNKSTCELAVPKGSKAAYQAASYWQDFTNITEVNFVSFNSQGGSAVPDITSKSDTIIAEPIAPTKLGYTFAGWYKEIGCTNPWNFSLDSIKTDTTLYAKWTINIYTVSFNSQGGSVVADLTANYNTKITAPTTSNKTGYTFAGWYKEAACNNAWIFATDVVTANTTLYAKWTINSYTVSFNSQGGSAIADLTANYNTTITAPSAPTKTGYTFDGWYKEAACNNVWTFATDVVTANTTLYTKWTINSYTVSFSSQGGSAIADLTANYNTTITAPSAPTKTGYTFAGWYKEAAYINTWTFATDVVIANVTLYAKWTEVTGIADNTSASEIRLYPNPATDYLIIKINSVVNPQCIAALYNINGKLLESTKIEGDETIIVLSNLEPATYFLKVTDNNKEIKTFKIIKK